MSDWTLTQLTHGSAENVYHAHSYYDVPVFNAPGGLIVAHEVRFAGRQPTPLDAISIGLINAGIPDSWRPIGESTAWSWQQGPLAQWIAGGPRLVWNDREDRRIVARVHDTATSTTRTLPAPVYAVDPAGRFALSLDMMRLDAVRPGYGYPEAEGALLTDRRPPGDGVRRMDLGSGALSLILPLETAVGFLQRVTGWRGRMRHAFAGYVYWFNHAKIAPDGQRFTVKLRWRKLGGPWNDRMGVSLTCGVDGSDLRLLADATSHVIWEDAAHLFFWREGSVRRYADDAPRGRPLGTIAPDLARANVHIRHLGPKPDVFVLDTPYRETVDLLLYDARTACHVRLARFTGHLPARGPFRCDLHPCPSSDGRRIVVTSLQDGGRQIYILDSPG